MKNEKIPRMKENTMKAKYIQYSTNDQKKKKKKPSNDSDNCLIIIIS